MLYFENISKPDGAALIILNTLRWLVENSILCDLYRRWAEVMMWSKLGISPIGIFHSKQKSNWAILKHGAFIFWMLGYLWSWQWNQRVSKKQISRLLQTWSKLCVPKLLSRIFPRYRQQKPSATWGEGVSWSSAHGSCPNFITSSGSFEKTMQRSIRRFRCAQMQTCSALW